MRGIGLCVRAIGLWMALHVVPHAAEAEGRVTGVSVAPTPPIAVGTSVDVVVDGDDPCGKLGIDFGDGTNASFVDPTLPLTVQHSFDHVGSFTIRAFGDAGCDGDVSIVVLVGSADLTVEVEQSPDNPVLHGSEVTYAIRVRNAGTADAAHVRVLTTLPGALWSSVDLGADCTFAGGGGAPEARVTCTSGSLAARDEVDFTFTMIAPPAPASPTFVRGIRVASRKRSASSFRVVVQVDPLDEVAETNELDNVQRVVTRARRLCDLVPEVVAPASAPGGQDFTYTVRVRNVGDGVASDVPLLVDLPPEVDLVGIDADDYGPCTTWGEPGAEFVTCRDARIGAGASDEVRVVVRLFSGAITQATPAAECTAWVDPLGGVGERNEANNTASASTAFQFSDLVLAALPKPRVGRGVSCTIARRSWRVTNAGPSPSPPTSVRVTYVKGPSEPERSQPWPAYPPPCIPKGDWWAIPYPCDAESPCDPPSHCAEEFPPFKAPFCAECSSAAHCPSSVPCRYGRCIEFCFDECPVPALAVGASADVTVEFAYNHDAFYAEPWIIATVDPDESLLDPDRGSNWRE